MTMQTSTIRRRNLAVLGSRHRGFTLLELVIVVAIAAIVSALLLGGFVNLSASNKRTSCQVNLQQIGSALRQYMADYDGVAPYYNADVADGGVSGPNFPVNATGLWRLYVGNPERPLAFPSTRDLGAGGFKTVGAYLRNSDNLHCPADNDDAHTNLYTDDTRNTFNTSFLSYQVIDDGSETFPGSTVRVPTYQPIRTTAFPGVPPATMTAAYRQQLLLWKRQLMHYDGNTRVADQEVPSKTVVTWCVWHRKGLSGHNSDPVLFADGSVKSLPLAKEGDPSLNQIPGWMRQY